MKNLPINIIKLKFNRFNELFDITNLNWSFLNKEIV